MPSQAREAIWWSGDSWRLGSGYDTTHILPGWYPPLAPLKIGWSYVVAGAANDAGGEVEH